MNTTPEKVTRLLGRATVLQLVEMWEETDRKKMTPDVATTRGWVMDKLEARDPEAFTKWIDSDQESPRTFYSV